MKNLLGPLVFIFIVGCAHGVRKNEPALDRSVANGEKLSQAFPDQKIRVGLLKAVVSEINRLDGDGLLPRKGRPKSWTQTVDQLEKEIKTASTWDEVGDVFRKLDATYTNLHAKVLLAPELDRVKHDGKLIIGASFAPELVEKSKPVSSYRISRVRSELFKDVPEGLRPVRGDVLLSINGRSLKNWSREAWLFCKFSQREQCETVIFELLSREILSWKRNQTLGYRLNRDGHVWDVTIPIQIQSTVSVAPIQPLVAPPSEDQPCGVDPYRYHPDYKLVYRGYHACVFERSDSQNIPILRIRSFRYSDVPQTEKIRKIKDEVDGFWTGYWKQKSPHAKGIVIDVIDNYGGDEPVLWYGMFFDHPYQEQYVSFKKIKEFENPEILDDLFYGQKTRYIWLDQLKAQGNYQSTSARGFLPPVPQFCPDKNGDCSDAMYQPVQHGFQGKVAILTNQWCISSCVGFVWNFNNVLKKRAAFFGMPDSGDSTYGRIYLDVYLDTSTPKGFRTETAGRPGQSSADLPPGGIIRQIVSVTKSTDKNGKVVSGVPMKMTGWVPERFHYTKETYEENAARLGQEWIILP
jgi:hypothetical protein